MGNIESLAWFHPETLLVVAMLAVVAVDLGLGRKRGNATLVLAVVGLGLALWSLFTRHDFLAVQPGIFHDMLAFDPLATFFKGIAIAVTLLVVLFAHRSRELDPERTGETHAFLLALAFGLCLMASARHIVMIYLAVELVSVMSYILAGSGRRNVFSAEAGFKYVVYGGAATGAMIFGFALLYAMTGTADLSLMGERIREGLASNAIQVSSLLPVFLLVMTGVGFKMVVAPFHMWSPDVYEGAPTPVSSFLTVAPKAGGFALLIRLLGSTMGPWEGDGGVFHLVGDALPWREVLGVLAAVTMTVGNLTALPQHSLKRMLAYSSVAHAGTILMGAAAGSLLGFQAVWFYFAAYAVMNLGAFFVVIAIANRLGTDDVRKMGGLGWNAPFLAGTFTIFLVSLTGLPPTVGFVGKLMLFYAVFAEGTFGFYVLGLVGLINSVISLYYYIHPVRMMFLREPAPDAPTIPLPAVQRGVLAVLAVATLALALAFGPLLRWTEAGMKGTFGGGEAAVAAGDGEG